MAINTLEYLADGIELGYNSTDKKAMKHFINGLVEELLHNKVIIIDTYDLMLKENEGGGYYSYKEIKSHQINLTKNSCLEINFNLQGSTLDETLDNGVVITNGDLFDVTAEISKCELFLFDGSTFEIKDKSLLKYLEKNLI